MSKRAMILAAWERGERDRGALAAEVGTSVENVRVVLSIAGLTPRAAKKRAAVQLWREGERDIHRIAAAAGTNVRGAQAMLQRAGIRLMEFTTGVYHIPSMIAAEAERRGQQPSVFAQRLLLAIAEDGIYDAVLDEAPAPR